MFYMDWTFSHIFLTVNVFKKRNGSPQFHNSELDGTFQTVFKLQEQLSFIVFLLCFCVAEDFYKLMV